MFENRKVLFLTIFIFAAAFAWSLFFTYGLDFFWEDFGLFHLDKEEYPIQADILSNFVSGVTILGNFIKDFFKFDRLFEISFASSVHDRPYLFHTAEFLGVIFGDKVILYKILKSLVFSLNAGILFLIISRLSVKFALAGAFLYITSSEMWVSLAYNTDLGIYTQFTMLVSILLFLHLLLEKNVFRVKRFWFYYFLILVASNYAVLTRCDGRYLAVLFILTIILFRSKEFKLHLPMLGVLLIMQLPVLGYIKKAFTGTPVAPINVASHNTRSLFESIQVIFSNLQYPRNALGVFLLVLLAMVIVIHLFSVLMKKSRFFNGTENTEDVKVKTFVYMMWFIFSFTMIAISRSFAYSGPYDWIVSECTFFIIPFIIFLCYYSYMVVTRIKKSFQTFFIIILTMLMVGQIGLNLPRINRFRGGWGNYFCAWKNVEKYVDKKSNNAVVYAATEMCYKPFVFRHSDNKVYNNLAGSHDLAFIAKIFEEKKYKDIFLARRFGVMPQGESKKVILKEQINIDGDTGDWYDKLKRMIGIYSIPVISVHHYVYKSNDSEG